MKLQVWLPIRITIFLLWRKTEKARNAALEEEATRVQKATVANELHAQKLVDTAGRIDRFKKRYNIKEN